MTFKAHWRISCQGKIDNEPCSFGVSVVGDEGPPLSGFGSFASLSDVVSQARTDFTTFLNSYATYMGTRTTWYGLRITEWNDAGDISGAAESLFTSPITGTGTCHLPPWFSLCCTLITDRPGRRYRGRIYLPMLKETMVNSGHVSSPAVDAAKDGITALLTGLNNAPGLDTAWNSLKCVISSQVASGANTVIKRVRVNGLADTQRRRQNDTAALYTTVGTVGGT